MTTSSQPPEAVPSFKELTHRGWNALQAGDTATAEILLRQAYDLTPNNPAAVHNLAISLLQKGDRTAIEELLARHSDNLLPGSWLILGDIYETSRRDTLAFRAYKMTLRDEPQNYMAHMRLAEVRKRLGDKTGATHNYKAAMEAKPGDLLATEHYTDAIFGEDPEESLRLREDLLARAGDNTAYRLEALRLLIPHKEWATRIRHGQMPYHATDLNELFFHYAHAHVQDLKTTTATLLESHADDKNFRFMHGLAQFCLGDRHAAETAFYSTGDGVKGKIYENIKFAPAFYDELRRFSDDDLVAGLPPLINLTPPADHERGVLYLSCNVLYFMAFALPMLVSLRAKSPDTSVHVHIMDASEGDAAFAVNFLQRLAPLKFAVSVEHPGLQQAPMMEQRCYYHAVRFIRFYQHMTLYRSPLWLMDVDALVNRDLGGLFAKMNERDAAMRIRPGRLEPWNQFNACVVGAGRSDVAFSYFRLLAAYVAYFHQRQCLRWGIDQVAMYGAFADLQNRGAAPVLTLLGEREVDYNYMDDGYVWCNSGAGKLQHLTQLGKPGVREAGKGGFQVAFANYWQETRRIARELGLTL